jgi:hypothetical protein
VSPDVERVLGHLKKLTEGLEGMVPDGAIIRKKTNFDAVCTI